MSDGKIFEMMLLPKICAALKGRADTSTTQLGACGYADITCDGELYDNIWSDSDDDEDDDEDCNQ